MLDDRAALIALRDRILSQRPRHWLDRLRWRRDCHRAQAMLAWQERRQEGPAALRHMGNAQILSFSLMWVGANLAPVVFSRRSPAPWRVALALVVSGIPLALWLPINRWVLRRLWRSSEREYARWLERAGRPAEANP